MAFLIESDSWSLDLMYLEAMSLLFEILAVFFHLELFTLLWTAHSYFWLLVISFFLRLLIDNSSELLMSESLYTYWFTGEFLRTL